MSFGGFTLCIIGFAVGAFLGLIAGLCLGDSYWRKKIKNIEMDAFKKGIRRGWEEKEHPFNETYSNMRDKESVE